ncbi:MAG: hypothetical protein AAB415_02890 [Patescibacteria group bacterium]
MKKFIILLVIIILIFFIYRAWNRGEMGNDLLPSPVTVTLATQNQSGETGQALLTEVDGQVKVVMNITDTPLGVAQPAHIHRGSCTTVGEVLYTLSPVTEGVSETTITATLLALKSSLPLAINVHKSVAEIGTYVACGDIAI